MDPLIKYAKQAPASIAIVLGVCGMSAAQWLNHPDVRMPRTADGRPNLIAPAPKTPQGMPDLSGIWRTTDALSTNVQGQRLADLANGAQIPLLPPAEELYRLHQANGLKDMSSTRCLPHGVPGSMLIRNLPFKIIQTPSEVVILFEEFLDYRQIFTDGRDLPRDPNPSWFGYSVGAWEQDTLVVRSIGFNDRTWLDLAGHVHSEALQMTERFRRINVGHMDIDVTIDDPKTFTKPWTVKLPFELFPDTELMEYVCENEKDASHIGK
jgi:hypothetical protein